MPSRQERRAAERDAAKRAPGQAGAEGAGGAAAALANLNVHVNPVGDWTTQAADPGVLLETLGIDVLKRRAEAGDREAQFSQGCLLMNEAGVPGTPLGAGGRSPKADVGFVELCTDQFPVDHKTEMWSLV